MIVLDMTATAMLVGLIATQVAMDPPAAPGAIAPNLMITADGKIVSTWVEGSRVRRSVAKGTKWGAPSTIVESASLVGNWADFPSVAVNGNEWLAHFPEKSSPEKYAYDVELLRSRDGQLFSRIGAIHDDGTPTEHGFVSILPDRKGFVAFWLDGRAMIDKAPMTLRTARVVDGKIRDGTILDHRVCECCQTSAAQTADGPFVVYRDRSDAEIRNISIVRRTADGWSKPALVHDDGWKMPGCPVNGPAADAQGNRAVVAWYTGVDGGHVRVAFSDDRARTFRTLEVHDHPDAIPLGRVDVALVDDGAIVSWIVVDGDDSARIVYRHVRTNGRHGAPVTLVETVTARTSGFPRMVRRGTDLFFLWTEVGSTTHIRGRVVPVDMRGTKHRATKPAQERDPRRYAAKSMSGAKVTLASLRGHVVLLNLWATWCGPCRREIPELKRLSKQFPKLKLIGVNVDEPGADARVADVIKREAITYPVWRDAEDRASIVFGATGLPTTYVIDEKGVVAGTFSGELTRDDPRLQKILAKLLTGSRGEQKEQR